MADSRTITALAVRASTQIHEGLAQLERGDLLACEVLLRAGCATLTSLRAALEAETAPLRKLALVRKEDGDGAA